MKAVREEEVKLRGEGGKICETGRFKPGVKEKRKGKGKGSVFI